MKKVFITGVSSGIGKELALEYAKKNTLIGLVARRNDLLNEIAEECNNLGSKTFLYQLDVQDRKQCEKVVKQFLEDAGGIDCVIANAGIGGDDNIFSGSSKSINNILRKVVIDEDGTASLADIHGYYVGGKTGTSQNYKYKDKNLNTFISIFPSQKPKYALLVMLENPQVAKDLIYNYRGMKVKGTRNEAGWNSAYVAGKIIKKIGPILAIKSKDFDNKYVAGKIN